MRRVSIILFITLLVITPQFSCITSIDRESDRKYTDQQWTSDLDSMYGFMKKTHPGLYRKTSQTEFDSLVTRIKADIPYLTDNQIITQLSRLAALVRDGHTVFIGGNLSERYFPVRIESFSDGYFVTAVSKKYSELYGTRVVKLGNCSIEEAFEKTGSVTSSDNIYSNLYFSSRNLTMGSFLNGLGIIDNTDSLRLETEEKSGRFRTVYIKGENYPFNDDISHKWFWYNNAVPDSDYININTARITNLPLRLKNSESPYWYEYLDGHSTMYFCFNSCGNDPEHPFEDFLEELWTAIELKKADKLIIDLRNNFGGTNDYLKPLIDGIASNGRINRKGHLFVMISPKTFSAAVHCAAWIEKNANPVFVGEPTGAGPNHYADPEIYKLPDSGLLLLVSSRYWQTGFEGDLREWIEPEIKAGIDSKEYFNGTDKALELILKNLK
jgi:hypothetical protein